MTFFSPLKYRKFTSRLIPDQLRVLPNMQLKSFEGIFNAGFFRFSA